ncbi:DUF1491 family protein [Sphingomonas arenae]|uniref:DUF1491 family protein n=1 Tax=Sphingomonas arenae TaxID=2812555 RepID=UPI0019671425
MEPRLASGVEVSALLRRAETLGGFGMVLHKGDEERGTILIAIVERGRHSAFLERTLRHDGRYSWGRVGPSPEDSLKIANFIAQRRRSDPDQWVIELDIPSAERFIAETSGEG